VTRKRKTERVRKEYENSRRLEKNSWRIRPGNSSANSSSEFECETVGLQFERERERERERENILIPVIERNYHYYSN